MAALQRALFLVLFIVPLLFVHGSAHRPEPHKGKNNEHHKTVVVVHGGGQQHEAKSHEKSATVVVNHNNKEQHAAAAGGAEKQNTVVVIQQNQGAGDKPTVVVVPTTTKPAGYKPNPRDPDARDPYASLTAPDKNFKTFKPVIPNKPPPTPAEEEAMEKEVNEQAKVNINDKEIETKWRGDWKLHSEDAFVSAMQMQLLPNNKAIMFDTSSFGPSRIELPKPHPARCRQVIPRPNAVHNAQTDQLPKPDPIDCWAHGVEYETLMTEPAGQKIWTIPKARPLKIILDTWCSSGSLSPDGTLVNTGGWEEGYNAVRHMGMAPNSKFKEKPAALASKRWYATQVTLEDGNFAVIGGRDIFSYELVPSNTLDFQPKQFDLPLLKETNDFGIENNLYPFAHLVPDGNIFLFANNRSILLQPNTGKVLREYPVLPGGARNYPASGMSALLPLDLRKGDKVDAEVLICGGAPTDAYARADKEKVFIPALKDCGRMTITRPDAKWEIEQMPSRRTMGDMMILPNTDILILSGAKDGAAGWQNADNPNFVPVLYSPYKKLGERFKELEPAYIPRMYHASAAVVLDGKVMVAGSNTNPTYNFTEFVRYKTETSVEKFLPPYFETSLRPYRPHIHEGGSDKKLKFGQEFRIKVVLNPKIGISETNVKVTMYAPPFTTHGYSMAQRLVVLKMVKATTGDVIAVAPPSGKIAPPGYYMLSVVHRGLPAANAVWVHLSA